MRKRNNPLLYLFLAVLCFIGAGLLNIRSGTLVASDVRVSELSFISENIASAIGQARQDAGTVQIFLRTDTLTFTSLLNRTQYPCFVFRKDKLIYWSTHTIIPEAATEPVQDSIRILENKFGKYLVFRKPVRHNYQIQIYVPLETNFGIQNYFLESGLNQEIFGKLPLKVSVTPPGSAKSLPVYAPGGKFLFSVEFAQTAVTRSSGKATLVVVVVGLVFFVTSLVFMSRRLIRQGAYTGGILLLVLPLLQVRYAMLYFSFPFSIVDLTAFDPKLYAASFWSPSIGDLLLNVLLLAVIAWNMLYVFRRVEVPERVQKLRPAYKTAIALALGTLYFLVVTGLFYFYHNLLANSLLVLDITQSVQFSVYKLLLYAAIAIHSAVFFLFSYMVLQVFSVLNLPRNHFPVVLVVVLLVLLPVNLLPYTNIGYVLFGISLAFCTGAYAWGRKAKLSTFPYQMYLFVFLILCLSSAVGSLAIYQHYLSQLQAHKQKFATGLLMNSDIQGEFLLEQVATLIQKDPLIQDKLKSAVVGEKFIKQKILKYYLGGYFDKYQTDIRIFNPGGNSSNPTDTIADYQQYRLLLNRYSPTEHKGLYLYHDPEQRIRRYVKVIPVNLNQEQTANIVLELSLKKLTPYSVVPELLVDQRFSQPLLDNKLSYAVFSNDRLQYSEGDFDYVNQFEAENLEAEVLYRKGFAGRGFHHLGIMDDGKTLVVTTPKYTYTNIFSNFSFLFLVHAAAFLLFMLVYLLARGRFLKEFRSNFSTKIQLFLNFGILIPLFFVSVATASLVNTSYKKDLAEAYQRRGRMIQENLLSIAVANKAGTDKEIISEAIREVAELSETDINLYDASGKLIATSQPLIFEAGLLSQNINPQAYAALLERRGQRIQLIERAGNLKFNALYMPLLNNRNKPEMAGFIGLPFFDSEKELDAKLIDLITTIMNIFTIMFLVFTLLTYLASRALTVPLKLITEKLKRTTLTGKNEMLVYSSPDEIGLLVNEYNQMLLKLEESKLELAAKEKEAAWREMARQVAHEIKNPLTPMKLSLQYLQKAIAEKRENTEDLINKISRTIITQIDILSDIATSFSNFTSLPELKSERIEINSILRQAVALHHDPKRLKLRTDIPDEAYFVRGDENLLMRTFNNLIINALQAIPGNRKPELEVTLQKKDLNTILISIRDNGSGIPADIRDKVFVPNFSTKYSGSGIGLAVAKKGIESAGGNIWFETEENKGTTFYIALPLAQE